MESKNIAINLAKAESEKEVIKLLTELNYWDNPKCWKPFGDNENNFSSIGNQQSSPDAALIEKIINSVDSILIKECLIRDIEPESPKAPQSISEALSYFFNIKEGKIGNLEVLERNAMSKNIVLAATGSKNSPSYTIIDKGEGQTPKKMPETILSIGRSNKLRIPFVQGKFNMGGTGVLQFCGKENLQLIITKKCPAIKCLNDDSKDSWGFTVVRRENPSKGRRSSMYTYLTDNNGNIISFLADKLDIVPTGKGYIGFEYGMFIKLFEYKLPGFKTNMLFDLNFRMALLMPNLAHPIRLIECRNYKGHTLETTLSGLNVRLNDDKKDNLEEDFPISLNFNIDGQDFNSSIYVFKEKSNDGKYRKEEGIIFSLNGQTHGSLNKSFFKRTSVNLSYLAKSLLIIVDCTNIDGRTREDLFMNSRDRLREGELKRKIEKAFEEYLRNHKGLKKIQEDRRREAISERLDDDKPLADILNNLLKNSQTLMNLFITGEKMSNPFDITTNGTKTPPELKKHPTFFYLKNKPNEGVFIKNVPINKKVRIQFETDAQNDYFLREIDPGKYLFRYMGKNYEGYGFNLFNGIASLTVTLPNESQIGDILNFNFMVEDSCTLNVFSEDFVIRLEPPLEIKKEKPGEKNKTKNNLGKNRKKTSGLDLPEIIELKKDDWPKYELKKDDSLLIINNKDMYDFFINMDNVHLQTEIKNLKDFSEVNLLKARYKYSNVLIGLSAISFLKKNAEKQNDDFSIEDYVKKTNNIMSPIILPLIEAMSDLNIKELFQK